MGFLAPRVLMPVWKGLENMEFHHFPGLKMYLNCMNVLESLHFSFHYFLTLEQIFLQKGLWELFFL